MDEQFRLGTGVQYSFNDNITVGAAYEYMNGGDNNIDVERGPLAGRLEGDYQSFDFHFFAREPDLAVRRGWRLIRPCARSARRIQGSINQPVRLARQTNAQRRRGSWTSATP